MGASYTRTDWNLDIIGNSRVYRKSLNEDTANDNVNLDWNWNYHFNSNLSVLSKINAKSVRHFDLKSKYDQVRAYSNFKITFSPQFYAGPVLGKIYDFKFSHMDPGTLYGVESGFKTRNPEAQTNSSAFLQSYYYDYQKRKNRKHQVNLHYTANFTSDSKDSIYVGYSDSRNFEYLNEDLEMEKVEIKAISVNNDLGIRPFSNLQLNNMTEFTRRLFSQDRYSTRNRRNENQLSNRLLMQYQKKNFIWQFDMLNLYQINDLSIKTNDDNTQTYQDSDDELDYNYIQVAFNNSFIYHFMKNQMIKWRLAYSKYEYNTPNTTQNFDDRDEIRFFSDLAYSWRISRRLTFHLNSGARYYHQIYISSQKSSLNKKEQILDLQTMLSYSRKNFRNRFSAEVSSFYITYDFAQPGGSIANLANRTLIVSDSLNYKFLTRSSLFLIYKYEIEEIGILDWNHFVEQITRENHYKYYICYFKQDITNLISINPGVSYFIREDFNYLTVKKQVRKHRNQYFWLEIYWKFTKNGFFKGRINKYLNKNLYENWISYYRGNLEVVWLF